MIYALPYIALICFYGLMALWYSKTQVISHKIWNKAICIVITIIFWGFRGFCFYDWMSYYPEFLQLDTHDLANNLLSTEPGFILLMTICKIIYNDYTFFMVVCTCINVILLTIFLRRNIDNFPLGVMICTAIGGIFLFTDLIRNAITIFIFINAIYYIKQREPIKYFLLCLLGLAFHYSAILYFLMYFILHRKINKWVFACVFVCGCAIFTLNISLLTDVATMILGMISPEIEERIRFYLSEIANTKPSINFVFIERVITGGLVICYMDRLRELRKDADMFINCIFIYFIFTFYLHEFVTLSHRMSLLFACGYWVIWYDLIKCFRYETNRKLFIIFIGLYCNLKILGQTQNIIAKYDNVLFDSETYQMRESMFNKSFKEQ